MLALTTTAAAEQAFQCPACPYTYRITQSFCTRLSSAESSVLLKKKRLDDVLGGAEAWQNVDSIDVGCPKCEHPRAYYMQIQIRSADEPSSIFYKCCSCGHQWREG